MVVKSLKYELQKKFSEEIVVSSTARNNFIYSFIFRFSLKAVYCTYHCTYRPNHENCQPNKTLRDLYWLIS